MKGNKLKRAARERVERWESLPADASSTPTTKFVRRHDGHGTTAFHRPGSQNPKKAGAA